MSLPRLAEHLEWLAGAFDCSFVPYANTDRIRKRHLLKDLSGLPWSSYAELVLYSGCTELGYHTNRICTRISDTYRHQILTLT